MRGNLYDVANSGVSLCLKVFLCALLPTAILTSTGLWSGIYRIDWLAEGLMKSSIAGLVLTLGSFSLGLIFCFIRMAAKPAAGHYK